MSALAELQRRFQQHLLAGDADVSTELDSSYGAPLSTRLAVYANAYRARLIEALAASYPQLRKLLGPQDFAALASDYIASHPSTFRSIRWFGAQLAACLEISHEDRPWLADLAQWEWALCAAFDAGDATPLEEAALAGVPAEEWPRLRFEFHPSVQRAQLHSNAATIYKALAAELEPPAPMVAVEAHHWLIWRRELSTHFRSLGAVEAGALAAAMSGAAFEDLCDLLCESYAPEEVPREAAALLRGWVHERLIVGAHR